VVCDTACAQQFGLRLFNRRVIVTFHQDYPVGNGIRNTA
jgi:hypothetical protein